MKILKYAILISITSLFALSCTQPPDYPDEPVIKFERLSKSIMQQGNLLQDSLLLTISFTDGDGDLGDEENNVHIRLKDKRINLESATFSIPLIPEQGSGNGISGDINMVVFTSCCILDNRTCEPFAELPVDTLIYEIQIEDRAGNLSNIVESDPIYLRCL